MSVVIRIHGSVALGIEYDPDTERYLASYDVDAHDGQGSAQWTDSIEEALRFADGAAAMAAWRSQSTLRPLRDDGQPNRPLTTFTIEVVPV